MVNIAVHAVILNEDSMFHLSHPPPHDTIASGRDGSLLKCFHPWEYIQLSTG